MTVLDHTVLPPTGHTPSLRALADALAEDKTPTLMTTDGGLVELPVEIVAVLRDAVEAMAAGRAVTVAIHQTSLTTQQAAELLGISRPTLVRLLEDGQIPFTQPGRHRRVALADLIDYQYNQQVERRRLLNEMTAEAAEYDHTDQANSFTVTR